MNATSVAAALVIKTKCLDSRLDAGYIGQNESRQETSPVEEFRPMNYLKYCAVVILSFVHGLHMMQVLQKVSKGLTRCGSSMSERSFVTWDFAEMI